MSAHDERLVGLHDLTQAKSYLQAAHRGLHGVQQTLKGIGLTVDVFDRALADISEPAELIHHARVVLWAVFTDEQKAKCA